MSTAETSSRLTLEAVVNAGGRVAEQEGLSAVSMRRVASDLGVTPMALYRHVGGIEQLRAAVIDRVIPVRGPPPSSAGSAGEVLQWAGSELFDLLTSQPLVLEAFLTQPLTSPRLRRLSEQVLAALAGTGMREEEAVACHKHLLALTVGYAALRLKWHRNGPPNRERTGAVAAAIQDGATTEGYPVLVKMAHHVAQPYTKAHFEDALRLLIAGLDLPTGGPVHDPLTPSRRTSKLITTRGRPA